MNRYKDTKRDFRVYESMSEVLDITASKANKQGMKERKDRHERKDSYYAKDWFGVDTAKEFYSAYTNGWKAGAKKLETLTGALPVVTTTDIKRVRVNGAVGSDVDIQKVYNGQLDVAWTERKRLKRPSQKSVSFLYDLTLAGGDSSDEVLARAAVAVKLGYMYKLAGYSVSIHGYWSIDNLEREQSSRLHLYFFPLLNFGEYQSFEKMAGACLAGVGRVFAFNASDQTEGKINSRSYGHCRWHSAKQMREFLPDSLPINRDNLIIIPQREVKNLADAKAFIKKLTKETDK